MLYVMLGFCGLDLLKNIGILMDLSVVVKVSLKSLNLDMKFLSVFCFLFFFTSFEVGSLYIIVLHLQLHLQFDGSVMLIGLLCCVLQTMSTLLQIL